MLSIISMMNCQIDKQLIVLLLALFYWTNLNAEVKRAPYSEKFQDYLEHVGNWDGFVPNPMEVNHNQINLRSGQLLPKVYDLRNIEGENFISNVKDQGVYGTCWSFATLAALESVWSKSGIGNYNLSVRNMTNCHGFEIAPYQGGNHQMSTAYLTRLDGPVLEKVDPYSNMSEQACLKVDNKKTPCYVTAAYYTDQNINAIKQLVYKYGGVATAMSASTLSKYINSNDATYYFDGDALINHAVTIVGWNDTLTVNGGLAGPAPQKGAWIVKNAYGTDFGDDGYFYASYYDANIGVDNVCYPEFVEKSNVDTLFMYDKLGPVSSRGYVVNGSGDEAYALVKYELDKPWFVNRIGLFFNSANGYADIYLGTSFNGISLQDTIAYKKDCFISYAGYNSFEVPALVDAGDLYIMIRYNTPGYSYPIPIETRIPYYAEPEIQNKGYQWISYNGKRWDAVGNGTYNNFDLCIRAYARKPDNRVMAYFEAIKTNCCKGDTAELNYYVQGDPDSLIWILNNNDTTDIIRTGVGEDAPRWVLEKDGLYSVSLIAYNEISADTITQTNCIQVTGSPSLTTMISKNTEYVAKGKSITLSAIGADSYKWSNYNGDEEYWGSELTYAPEADSVYINVCGYLGSCEVNDSVLVKSVSVEYDDIQTAYSLEFNKTEGPFSNYYATVEEGEPSPEQGNCEDQIKWCKEGGLHNSLWFTFEGPESGEVTIESSGFDNQLALYEVFEDDNSWYNLLSNDDTKFRLLAANDDAHDDYSAALYNVSGLIEGKKYYLQMDGSAGGSMGEATILLKSSLIASIDDENVPYNVDLINNTLKVEVNLNSNTNGEVRIFDALGRVCEVEELISGANSLSYTLNNKSFYLVQIEVGNNRYVEKVLVQ